MRFCFRQSLHSSAGFRVCEKRCYTTVRFYGHQHAQTFTSGLKVRLFCQIVFDLALNIIICCQTLFPGCPHLRKMQPDIVMSLDIASDPWVLRTAFQMFCHFVTVFQKWALLQLHWLAFNIIFFFIYTSYYSIFANPTKSSIIDPAEEPFGSSQRTESQRDVEWNSLQKELWIGRVTRWRLSISLVSGRL